MNIFLQAPLEIPGAEKKHKKKVSLTGQALIWQFWDVPKEILKGWRNFLVFNLNYFSLPILLKTFFSHWRRYRYSYRKTFELWENIEISVFNIMSRIIGAILRTFLIILGLIIEVLIILIGAIVFLSWFLLPVLLLAGLLFGLKLCLI